MSDYEEIAGQLYELICSYTGMDYCSLLELARGNYAVFKSELDSFFDEKESLRSLLTIASACLGADKQLSPTEHRFFCDFLNCDLEYEYICERIAEYGNEEGRNFTDTLADALSDEARGSLLSFCMCFMAVDKRFTVEESIFLLKLFD